MLKTDILCVFSTYAQFECYTGNSFKGKSRQKQNNNKNKDLKNSLVLYKKNPHGVLTQS